METILNILDVIVLLVVVASLARAVWKPVGGGGSALLASVLTLAFVIFGIVSFSGAEGLAGGSAYNQRALLIFLVAISAVSYLSWQSKPAN